VEHPCLFKDGISTVLLCPGLDFFLWSIRVYLKMVFQQYCFASDWIFLFVEHPCLFKDGNQHLCDGTDWFFYW
jgi:hypothetical protein